MSGPEFFKQSVESSKIIIGVFESNLPSSCKNRERGLNNLKYVFNRAAQKDNSLEFCLASVFQFLTNLPTKISIKHTNNEIQVFFEDEITEESCVKAKSCVKEILLKGYCEKLKPLDLYIESPFCNEYNER